MKNKKDITLDWLARYTGTDPKKYGDWILNDPGFTKNTYILWLLPILKFLVGGAIILRLFII